MRTLISLVVAILVAVPAVLAASPPDNQSLLPRQFAGWQAQAPPATSQNPASADPTNAAVLKEYGFFDFASATYTRDDGRTLKIRAARFADASGAFGAYTFYLQPDMALEQIGDQGASLGQRVLFYRGHILIDALFSKESPMAGAELRELAGLLPRPTGNGGVLPPILDFLPRRSYIANTQKYVMGPTALGALAPPISADLVDFSVTPDVTFAKYSTSSGEATLLLIYYPNSQSAAEHLRRIDARRGPNTQPGVASIENAGQFFDKRTGPIVAVATGPASDSDVKSLLGEVNYDSKVTWSQRTFLDPKSDLGGFLVNVILLCFILGAMAIVAGIAFGGVRIVVKRLFPERVFDRPEQMEFISLHLTETLVQGAESGAAGAARGPNETPPNSR